VNSCCFAFVVREHVSPDIPLQQSDFVGEGQLLATRVAVARVGEVLPVPGSCVRHETRGHGVRIRVSVAVRVGVRVRVYIRIAVRRRRVRPRVRRPAPVRTTGTTGEHGRDRNRSSNQYQLQRCHERPRSGFALRKPGARLPASQAAVRFVAAGHGASHICSSFRFRFRRRSDASPEAGFSKYAYSGEQWVEQ